VDSLTGQFLIILVLTFGNAFFAASEIAIVSARRGRLQQRADNGSAGARVALDLQENPNRFLSTVQVGITLINFVSGVFAGERLSQEVRLLLASYPLIAPIAEALTFVIVVVVLSYLTLIIGELVPKRLALQAAESIAVFVAPIMLFISRISAPVVAFLTFSTNLVLRLLGQSKVDEDSVTEEDIKALVREGTEGGSLDAAHQELIESVFVFTERSVRTIMTPRTEIVALDIDTPFPEALQIITESGYSRLPVYRDHLDRLLGMLFVKDLLTAWGRGPELDIEQLLRPATFVLESQRVVEVFQQMKQGRGQIALVLDEYGQVAGLVTVEDMLEELVGDISDEYDEAGESLVHREDGSYLVDGLMPFEELKARLDLPEPSRELDEANFETVAGFFLALLGHIPITGEQTNWQGYTFEVVDMDERRIDKLLIRPPS
jgi:putative hemolysin